MVLNPSFFFAYHDRCANWQYNSLDVFDHRVLIRMESFMHGATAMRILERFGIQTSSYFVKI